MRTIAVRGDFLVNPFWDGQVIAFTSTAGYIYRLAVDDRFYPFSTNAYTLPYIMNAAASSIDCVLFACHDVVDVTYESFINDEKASIVLHPLALGSTVKILTLPPPPSDYWNRF